MNIMNQNNDQASRISSISSLSGTSSFLDRLQLKPINTDEESEGSSENLSRLPESELSGTSSILERLRFSSFESDDEIRSFHSDENNVSSTHIKSIAEIIMERQANRVSKTKEKRSKKRPKPPIIRSYSGRAKFKVKKYLVVSTDHFERKNCCQKIWLTWSNRKTISAVIILIISLVILAVCITLFSEAEEDLPTRPSYLCHLPPRPPYFSDC